MSVSTGQPGRRGALASLLSKIRGDRNSVLLFDTACTALASMLLVVAASRSLHLAQLTSFSLAQLFLVTLVSLARTAVWGPAMAAQRSTGKVAIPLAWVPVVSLPVATAATGLMLVLIPHRGTSAASWVVVLLLTAFVLLMQDGVRSVLMSREASVGALWSDAVALVLICVGLLSGRLPRTAVGVVGFWGACMAVALILALVFLARRVSPAGVHQSFGETWRIGRWGAVDAGLSSFATLLPMFSATLVVGSDLAGPYRTLQTAMGPLNILHTTVVTAFGLDAWQSASREGVRQLARRTRRLAWMFLALSVAYVGIGIPAMALVAQLHSPDLVRVGVLVGLSALMGAVNTPFNAASLALGYQRFGALIRALVVAVAIGLSLPWTVENLVPWNDPIGVNMVTTSAITFGGWLVSYRLAMRKEQRRPRRVAAPEEDDPR